MPEAISSRESVLEVGCDPSVACCGDVSAGESPPVVTIPPVQITGSAEKDLVKCYNQQVSDACRGQRDAAIVGCTQVLSSITTLGYESAFTNSFECAQLMSAYDDCKEVQAARLEVVERCEDEGGYAVAGARSNEIICDKR